MNEIGVHYDHQANHRDSYIARNGYYYRLLFNHYRKLIPQGKNVLEIGCGTGSLLAALQPKHGTGIDLSAKMIEKARQKYTHLQFLCGDISELSTTDEFDYIILAGTLGESKDIQALLESLHQFCNPKTRIVIEYFNPLWQYALKLAEKTDRKLSQPWQNWLTTRDIRSFLSLTNFECISSTTSVLIPFRIPLISWIFNKYLARLPIVRTCALSQFIVARALGHPSHDYSVSIVIPCRNEKGNVENAIHRIPHFSSNQEIIFVEGHSQDGTYQEIQRVMSENPEINLTLLRQPGTGKGDAVRAGFGAARNDVLMILDADLTVAPEDLPRFYNALVSEKGDLINGSRLIYPMQDGAMQFFNTLANKLFGVTFSWLLGQPITDTLCGTKVLLRRDYLDIEENRAYFGELDPFGDFDLLFGASRLHMKIVDLPIRYRERVYGKTNIQRWRHGWQLLKMTVIAARKIKFL